MKRIYLDNHATTRTDPRVVEAMLPYFDLEYGNPASKTHAFGWAAEEAVDRARQAVGRAIGAPGRDIVFTSGATEANNLALQGLAEARGARGDHLVATTIEHKSVLDTLRRLEARGIRHTLVRVGPQGVVDPEDVARAIEERTMLVSVMAANNEIGTLQPLAEVGRICRERGVTFHTDASQMVGKLPLDVERLGIDLLSLSGHKIYGPKGVGALYVRSGARKVTLAEQIHGGGHEGGRRSGTLNVPGIVGLARALEIAGAEMASEGARLRQLRDRLASGILAGLEGVTVNGDLERRLPGSLNLSFPGVDGEALMMALQDLAVSSGSACTSASLQPSYVLRAIGVDEESALSSVRFGIGRFNDESDIERAVTMVVERVQSLRQVRKGGGRRA